MVRRSGLVMFTADRRRLAELIAPRWLTVVATITAAIIIVRNLKLLVDFAFG
jgi:manganese transport protein